MRSKTDNIAAKARPTKCLLQETPFRSTLINFSAIIYEVIAFIIHVFYNLSSKDETMICLTLLSVFFLLKSPFIIWWTFYTNEVNRRKDHEEEILGRKRIIIEEAQLRKAAKEEIILLPLENQDFLAINFLENVDFLNDFSSNLDVENLPTVHRL